MSRPRNILQASIGSGGITASQLEEGVQEAKDYADTLTSPILFVEHTILAAELATVAATPKTLIDAPGEGRYIKLRHITVKQLTLTVDHPAGQGGNFTINWGNAAQTQIRSIGSITIGASYPDYWTYNFLESTLVMVPASGTSSSSLNLAVILKDLGTTTLVGDNYMKIKLEYTIETY